MNAREATAQSDGCCCSHSQMHNTIREQRLSLRVYVATQERERGREREGERVMCVYILYSGNCFFLTPGEPGLCKKTRHVSPEWTQKEKGKIFMQDKLIVRREMFAVQLMQLSVIYLAQQFPLGNFFLATVYTLHLSAPELILGEDSFFFFFSLAPFIGKRIQIK